MKDILSKLFLTLFTNSLLSWLEFFKVNSSIILNVLLVLYR